MKSSLTSIFGIAFGIFCLVISAQVAVAQSGNRNSGYQPQQTVPQQRFPSAAEQNYGTAQNYRQLPQAVPFASQSRKVTRVGFEQYDHRSWDALLQKYVDQNGDVDYATWQTSEQDRSTLMSYLRGMNSIDTSLNSNQQSQMAFWINAYNALTIEGILRLFPTKSIKDHAPDANGFNIWDDFKLPVNGTEYSLNDIEHQILRKMGDPRIHFAIVCASKSCPQLSQRAYFPDSLDQQLAYSSGLFFHTPGKFSYNLQQGQIGLSPIIQWFGEDFGRSDQERLQYLSQFMPADAARLATSGSAAINYLEYDWGLNVAPPRTQAFRQNFAPNQNAGTAQALQPQGSATRQQAPVQSQSRVQVQALQGSGTRGPIDTFRPQQQSCCKNGCR